MDYLARVNPRYFAAVSLFAAVSDVRYYLCGVMIEPSDQGGVVMVATDGHTMAAIHDPDGMCKAPMIVATPSRSLLSACKAKGRPEKCSVPNALWLSDRAAVLAGGISEASNHEWEPDPFAPETLRAERIKLIEGRFPDYRRFLPGKLGEPTPIFINESYFNRIAMAAKILSPGRYCGVAVQGHGGDRAVARALDFVVADRFVAIVMGLRDFKMPQELPAALS